MKTLHAWNAQPFVGYVSSGESVEFVQDGAKLVCRQTRGATLIMVFIVVMIFLGGYFAVTSPEMERHIRQFQRADILGKVLAGLVALLILWLVGAALVFTFKQLFANKRVVIDASGCLNLLSGFDPTPIRTIRPDEMEAFHLEKVTFQGKRRTHTCHLLVLRLKSQESLVLCSGVDQERLEQQRQAITQRCGLRE